MIHPTPTLDQVRMHVLEDGLAIAKLTGVSEQLIVGNLGAPLGHVPAFMRRHFTEALILVLVRMHEPAGGPGPTGHSASIETLLALSVDYMEPGDFEGFHASRCGLLADIKKNGTSFKYLKQYRHAKLCHTLFRTETFSDETISYHAIWQFAHDTFELVYAIDQTLQAHGRSPIEDLNDAFHLWRNRGEDFWRPLLPD